MCLLHSMLPLDFHLISTWQLVLQQLLQWQAGLQVPVTQTEQLNWALPERNCCNAKIIYGNRSGDQ
jgi:hypothetical protein